MSPDVLGQLGIPGSLAAVVLLIYYLNELVEKVQSKKHANGSGPSWQTSITAAVTSLTSAVTQLGKDVDGDRAEVAEMRKELGEIRRVVDRTELKLEQTLCREDAMELAEKNRKVMHEGFQALAGKLDALTRESVR